MREPTRPGTYYTKRDLAVLWYCLGLLTGLLVAFAACTPTPDAANPHTTTGGQP
jgi:hypothetical protein